MGGACALWREGGGLRACPRWCGGGRGLSIAWGGMLAYGNPGSRLRINRGFDEMWVMLAVAPNVASISSMCSVKAPHTAAATAPAAAAPTGSLRPFR